MANKFLAEGKELVDLGGGVYAEQVVAVNADGSAISGGSVTAGTEYTEGNTDATITGTAVMWEDAADTLRPVSAAKPLPVNVVSGSATNTEYTEGGTDATITGTAMLWEDTSDTLRSISAAKPLPVNVISGVVTGTEYTEGATDSTITGVAMMFEIDTVANTLGVVSDTSPLSVQQAQLTLATDTVGAVATGNVAHDGVDTGNPVKIGGKAASTVPTAVAAGDRVDALYSLTGKQVVSPYALGADRVSGATSDITTTTATTVVAAPGAGLSLAITHILVQNSHATVSTWVNITEETSGTVLYTVYAPALGGGASLTLPAALSVPTANKALQATCVTTGANVRVSASGYKA